MTSSIDERLTSIELCLGITSSTSDSAAAEQISDRVQSLYESTNSLFQSQQSNSNNGKSSSTLEKKLSECQRIASKLDIHGLIFTSSLSSNEKYTAAPLIYRKQELLARSQDLEYALEQLAKIRDLLSISNPNLTRELPKKIESNNNTNSSNGGQEIPLDHVADAPIISSPSFTFASDEMNQNKLNNLSTRILDVNDRATILVQKYDHLINTYYTLMTAVNEKLVLYQEALEYNKK